MRTLTVFLLLLALAGCSGGGNQPEFPELNPVKGVVKKDGKIVAGGSVKFTPEPDTPEFLINSDVGPDGTFSLSTVRTTDKSGERRPGAAAGKYKVTYSPPAGDQVSGPQTLPVTLPKLIEVQPGDNNLTLDLPKK